MDPAVRTFDRWVGVTWVSRVSYGGWHFGSCLTRCVPRDQRGSNNPNWKGGKAEYQGIHAWMRKNYPKTGCCEHCGSVKKTTYASKSHTNYTRDRADYLELCYSCHLKFDNHLPSTGHDPTRHPRFPLE